MAQLLVAAAGAAIGGATLGTGVVALGMTGTSIGWMAGSLLGAMLFKPPPQEGPRVEDKKITTTTYGETIPFVWGTDRCKAHVLWSSDLIEAAEEVGGKGFGGPDGVMYTYSVNILLSVCKSPLAKPRYPLRLWGNGRLIATFNGQSWETDEALIPRANVREYIGTETQDPDPVYETAVGTENAPAYIGQLTIMLEGLQLADFGNRAPNFEVEVTSEIEVEGCPTAPILQVEPAYPYIFTYGGSQKRFSAAYDAETRRYFVLTQTAAGAGYAKQIEVYNIRQGEEPVLDRVIPLIGISSGATFGGAVIDPENRVMWIAFGYNTPNGLQDGGPIAARVSLDGLTVAYSGAQFNSWVEPGGGICYAPGTVVCPAIIRTWGSVSNPNHLGGDGSNGGTGALYGAMMRVHPTSGTPTGEVSWGIDGSAIINYRFTRLVNGEATAIEVEPCPICFRYPSLGSGIGWHEDTAVGAARMTADVLYIPQPEAGTPSSSAWIGGINYQVNNGGGVVVIGEDSATPVTGDSLTMSAGATAVFSRSRKKVFILSESNVAAIDLSLDGDPYSYIAPFATLSSLPAYTRAVWSEDLDGLVLVRFGTSETTITVVDPETDAVIAGPCVYDWSNVFDGQWASISEVGGGWFVAVSFWGMSTPQKVVMFKAPGSVAMGGGVPLSEIVSDVWEMSGGDLAEIDVSELTDIVPGYTLARQAAGRGVIQPLMGAWFFDCVESGLKVKWPKMGKAHVATIDSGELGAALFQLTRSEPEPPYELEHIDENEAPRELTLKYIDALANYDPGTQRAMRQAAGSLSPATLDLPIVLEADHAAEVVWTHLMRAHAAKNPIKFALSHAYEALEPADAIAVPLANGDFQRIVIQKRTTARPLIEYEGVLEDPSVWDRAFPGIERGQLPRQNTPAELNDTELEIMDLPPLRQEDNRIVAYMAMSRASGNAWPGAMAYKSTDGGASYTALYNTSAEATMGYIVTTLPAWSRGNVWDRENTVRVYLRRGTLSSATELAVLNGANVAVVGNEIIQFANATLIGDGIWELDTLLRHRLGTEWAALTDHAMNTRFVLLTTASIRAVEYPLSDMNVARSYKAVTAGQALADGTVESFSGIGNSVKPLAPVKVQGVRDMSDNLTVTWIRRARLNADWQDGFDVPLDEPSEQYRVYVFTSAARTSVARTEDVTSPTWTYTAAEQTTDFGTPQDEVHLSIYQITPTYNALGHAAEATV